MGVGGGTSFTDFPAAAALRYGDVPIVHIGHFASAFCNLRYDARFFTSGFAFVVNV